jgi:hypothetical protein
VRPKRAATTATQVQQFFMAPPRRDVTFVKSQLPNRSLV